MAHTESDDIAVSVIIPAYNIEKYIEECLESILKQTIQEKIEIIVVDDASPDNSIDIIRKIAQREANNSKVSIRYIISPSNEGLGASRNKGLKEARGKYVYFLDGDDAILPQCLEVLFKTAEVRSADIVHMSSFYAPKQEGFDSSKKMPVDWIKEPMCPRENVAERMSADMRTRLTQGYIQKQWAVMVWLNLYKREFLQENRIKFSHIIHEDNPFAVACLAATDRIWNIPVSFYLYRQREGSITHDQSDNRLSKLVEALIMGLRKNEKDLRRILNKEDYDSISLAVQMAYFNIIFENIKKFYTKKDAEWMTLKNAVTKVIQDKFPEDGYFIGIMFHFLGLNLNIAEDHPNSSTTPA